MNKHVKITCKKELRSIVRDKKSLLMMFVMPLFIPLFVFMFSALFDNITDPDQFVIGVNYEMSEVKETIVEPLNLEMKVFDSKDELNEAYEEGEITAFVYYADNSYTIFSNPHTSNGAIAAGELVQYLTAYNNYLGHKYLVEHNINPAYVFNIVHYDLEELPGTNDMISQILFIAFVFAIISITTTATQTATDSTAGEKERGTLETLLTFPIKSKSLIMGKYVASLIACFVTAIFCGILLYVSLFFAQDMFNVYDNVIIAFDATTMSLAFILLIGYSLFISGLSIVIASLTKTYKEAQSTLMPLTMLPMLPMFINMFGRDMDIMLSLIPIVNHTLLLNELFVGNVNMLYIYLMFASTIVFTFIIIRYLIAQYKSEKILFSL